jgi:transcriptional regulator with GAF, ATPase, and Fis domain
VRLSSDTERVARAVAGLTRPLLLLGERGTGKTTLARRLHEWSGRGQFVAVNCAAIPAGLFEGELFGHVKGAFTGATAARAGLFEEADGGTLFLDELGELPVEAQAKLLAVAESGALRQVGASKLRQVDVRIIAATNRDRAALRPDLLDRFCYALQLLPLRERGDAIELARAWLPQASSEVGARLALTQAASTWVAEFEWPGNIRQLHTSLVVAGAVASARQGACRQVAIDVEDIELATGAPKSGLAEAADRLTIERGWWSATELAEAAGVHAATARRWCASNGCVHNGQPTGKRRWRRSVSGP